MYRGAVVGNIVVRGIDIGARRAKVGIEGQRLIEPVGDVEIRILRDASIVGVEVAVVPLVAAVVAARTVRPAVVAPHGQHVVARLDVGRQVEAAGHDAILAHAQVVAVEVEVGTLTDSLELDEVFRGEWRGVCVYGKRLAIPADGIGEVYDILLISLVAVEGIGQGDALPPTVVVAGLSGLLHVSNLQVPVGIKVEFQAFGGLCCQANQCDEGSCQ